MKPNSHKSSGGFLQNFTHRGVLVLLGFICGAFLSGCASTPSKQGGWYTLKWMEKPSPSGPSKNARPEDLAQFELVGSFEHDESDTPGLNPLLSQLREGDVIAYRMGASEARKKILTGDVAKIGYRLFKYGHLAILVDDPATPGKLRIFSSQSFQGANLHEGLDTLSTHTFDVYRLDKWGRVDKARLHEFVGLALQKAGHWYGYDFSGMFGLWNSNLAPNKPDEIGHDYIYSTIVLTALYYSGLELDAYRRGGLLDIVTPAQVVESKGRLVTPPEATFDVVTQRSDCGSEAQAC